MRGTGYTTSQMQAAAQGSIFVWHHDDTRYPQELARKINRTDLKIVGPSYVNSGNWMGLSYPGVCVDHYAFDVMTDKTRYNVQRMAVRAGR